MPQPPRVVGLFADQPLVEVSRVIEYAGLDMAQLCGRESPDYCRQVLAKTGAGVIKVQHVSGQGSGDATYGKEDDTLEDQLLRYREAGCYITLDRLVEGLQGGTGQSFDWDIAAQLSRKGYEFLLAGGLTPANVAQAVARVRPWGVDVSSGVETDGANDPKKSAPSSKTPVPQHSTPTSTTIQTWMHRIYRIFDVSLRRSLSLATKFSCISCASM